MSSECWSLTVHQHHALYGDYTVTEGCCVKCEINAGWHRWFLMSLCDLPKAGKLCVCGRMGLVSSQAPNQGFDDFVETYGKYNRNQ